MKSAKEQEIMRLAVVALHAGVEAPSPEDDAAINASRGEIGRILEAGNRYTFCGAKLAIDLRAQSRPRAAIASAVRTIEGVMEKALERR